jgi:hypothetical protein
VRDDVCGSLKRTHLGDARNDFAIPLYHELEFLVWINSTWVYRKLWHTISPLFSFSNRHITFAV